VIICLGESIVEIGVGANHRHLDAELVVTIVSGVLITVGMWWTYFDSSAAVAAARLRDHGDPVLAAADGYSYLHLLIVAGIIVFAAGMRVATLHSGGSLGQAARLALCGGVALYLIGHGAFRARLTGSTSLAELVAAGAVALVGLLGGGLHAWAAGVIVAAVLALLCASEARATRSLSGP
jgi:low temperature requirement protein LtrA